MSQRRLNNEHLLYFLAFLLALFLRLLNLGAAPLTEFEASWALQALHVAGKAAPGLDIAAGAQPAYVLLTGGLFALFPTGNFLARLLPALAGSLLVLSPLFFLSGWRRNGDISDSLRRAGILLAFSLAIDPGLAALSRVAGGPMLAITFSLLAAALWADHRPALAGVAGGLALLSGAPLLVGLLGIVLAALAARLLATRPRFSEEAFNGIQPDGVTFPLTFSGKVISSFLVAGGAAFIVLASLFLLYPPGMASWLDTLPAFLAGWAQPSGIPAARLLAALFVYQPLALIFALITVIATVAAPRFFSFPVVTEGGNERRLAVLLGIWSLFALLVALVYPGRQAGDLAWVLVPIWGLAAIFLGGMLPAGSHSLISLGHAALVFLFLALAWLNLAGIARATPGELGVGARLGIMAAILVLTALTTTFVALGWSVGAGVRGLVWGLCAAFSLYLIAALWGATQERAQQPQELWSPPPATGQAGLFLATLEDLSKWKTGFPDQIDVTVVVDSPALRWLLRDYPNAQYLPVLPVNQTPSVLVTGEGQTEISLPATYRGQDFAWQISPGWQGALPPDLAGWLAFRQAPLEQHHIILWAREDLFSNDNQK